MKRIKPDADPRVSPAVVEAMIDGRLSLPEAEHLTGVARAVLRAALDRSFDLLYGEHAPGLR